MLSSRRLVAVCAVVFCCNVAFMVLFVKYNINDRCFISISEHQEVSVVVSDEFLSVGIDTSQVERGGRVPWGSARLRALAAALAPARLRLGGTMSERLVFSRDDAAPPSCDHCHKNPQHVCSAVRKICKHKNIPFFIMTASEWNQVNKFCNDTNLKLLFSFNVLLRNENGWSDQNAKEILSYSQSNNFKIDWQLGNEPNSFQHKFNVTITPEQLSHDFRKLRHALNEYDYKSSLLVGPDTTRPQPHRPECLQYMVQFLGNVSHFINVRSWHQYYLNSRTAKLSDFWNPSTFDLLKEQIKTMRNNTGDYKEIPMWLTETSSSYGGGAPGLSDSYAGTPLWVDKLGLSAKYNITTVVRQSLFGGNYSLVDKELEPLPDWWASVLHKRLVGNKVLHLKCKCSRHQRFYIHCASRRYTNDTSAVTVFGLNLELSKIKLKLNGTALHGDNFDIDEYIISAPSNNRLTKTVLLNGWPLYYESPVPELTPRHIKYGNHISMPPYSIGFWVIKNTSIKVCS
ncbi:heparanase [Plutella xylostella]|uniref:heparanase n=1 Tax=Plutella xylostella TaxID=51655 RepID=UPI002032869B|nr:heparanase [Plutella xylostella]